jgi:hypothetical protein
LIGLPNNIQRKFVNLQRSRRLVVPHNPWVEAAYRFFDNDKVSPEKILQPHIEATRERISQSEVVLLVQDTTVIDLTRPKQQV